MLKSQKFCSNHLLRVWHMTVSPTWIFCSSSASVHVSSRANGVHVRKYWPIENWCSLFPNSQLKLENPDPCFPSDVACFCSKYSRAFARHAAKSQNNVGQKFNWPLPEQQISLWYLIWADRAGSQAPSWHTKPKTPSSSLVPTFFQTRPNKFCSRLRDTSEEPTQTLPSTRQLSCAHHCTKTHGGRHLHLGDLWPWRYIARGAGGGHQDLLFNTLASLYTAPTGQ